jgi:uncharacterized protein (TIGR02266 family)
MTTDDLQKTSRRAPRIHHEFVVSVTSDQGAFSGWGTNLSLSGVFVNSHSAPEKGSVVVVLLQLPGEHEVKLRGRVVWSQPSGPGIDEPGMGLQFIEPDAESQRVLGRMVERLTKDLAQAAT